MWGDICWCAYEERGGWVGVTAQGKEYTGMCGIEVMQLPNTTTQCTRSCNILTPLTITHGKQPLQQESQGLFRKSSTGHTYAIHCGVSVHLICITIFSYLSSSPS